MAIFGDGDNEKLDSNGCPIEPGEQTIYQYGTAHNTLYYTTAACAAVSFILSVSLIFLHLRRYRVPKEQRQIVKIIFSPFAFAIVAFGSLSNYRVAPYISELGEWYSAICFPLLFLLFIEFAVPDSEFGEGMFQAMHKEAQHDMKGEGGGWPKISWIMVFQYPVTETLAIIILEGTTASGTFCDTSFKPKFGHLWFMIIKTVGLAACFIAVLRFYKKIKPILKARRGASKLFMFKGIVGLRFLQTWIFNILVQRGVMKPSNSFSMGDLVNGIPNVVLAAEMVVFSAGFWYAYSSTEYSTNARPNHEHINFFKALLDVMNPADIIMGILRIPALLMGRNAQNDQYGAVASQTYQPGYSMDGSDTARMQYGHGETMYQPPPGPPPFRASDEEEAGAKTHLFADSRQARTPSPRPY